MQQQQQHRYADGSLSPAVLTILNMFKQCGGTSSAYKSAVKAFPKHELPNLHTAIDEHKRERQQQEQQLQL